MSPTRAADPIGGTANCLSSHIDTVAKAIADAELKLQPDLSTEAAADLGKSIGTIAGRAFVYWEGFKIAVGISDILGDMTQDDTARHLLFFPTDTKTFLLPKAAVSTDCQAGYVSMGMFKSADGFALICDEADDAPLADTSSNPNGFMVGDYSHYTIRISEPQVGDVTYTQSRVTGPGVPCATSADGTSTACVRNDYFYVNGSSGSDSYEWNILSSTQGVREAP